MRVLDPTLGVPFLLLLLSTLAQHVIFHVPRERILLFAWFSHLVFPNLLYVMLLLMCGSVRRRRSHFSSDGGS